MYVCMCIYIYIYTYIYIYIYMYMSPVALRTISDSIGEPLSQMGVLKNGGHKQLCDLVKAMAQGSGLRTQGLMLMAQSSGLRAQGSGLSRQAARQAVRQAARQATSQAASQAGSQPASQPGSQPASQDSLGVAKEDRHPYQDFALAAARRQAHTARF